MFSIENFGKESTGLYLNNWSKTVESHGAGEILIQSIDNDGTGEGYDIGMIKTVADTVDIPVIALGGVGTFEHFSIGYFKGKATALAAANIFHFTEHSILNAKEYLRNNNIEIRVQENFKMNNKKVIYQKDNDVDLFEMESPI